MGTERSIRTAVVTGPTGVIGHALCARLLKEGVRVYAVCRPGSPRAENLAELNGLNLVLCDMAELNTLPEKVGQADAFFHLAWASSTGAGRNDMSAQVKNIQCALEAVRAAKAMGCAVFLGAGSQAEYGRVEGKLRPDTPCFPENGYGMAKLCAGQMSRLECEKLGLDHIWPRILSVYGPHAWEYSMIPTVIHKLLAGEKPALTPAGQLWDFLYADDAAEAMYLAALRGKNGAVYPLGSGKARPLREYVEALRDAVDHSLPLGFGELPYGKAQIMHLEADISTLEADTGFRPVISFSQGIRITVKWLKEQKT